MTDPPLGIENAAAATPGSQRIRAHLAAVLGLIVFVWVAYCGTLYDGLFFDDHWHRVTLRDASWSFDDMVEAATFDLPGRLAQLWWQTEPLQWRYARPVAMAFMRVEYLASGGDPFWVHFCAISWHTLNTLLVYALACWALRQRRWAFVAAVLFAVQPHAVFAVGWIAARNALVSCFFLLLAVNGYVLASARREQRGRPLSVGLFAAVLAAWLLALFSRETAIVFAVIVLAIDAAVGGWRLLWRRWWAYALIAGLSLAYLYWRLVVFPTTAPPEIYFTAPSGPAYLVWALGKLLYMFFALFFHTPFFVGISSSGGGGAMIGMYALMSVLVGLVGLWYLFASRGDRLRWIWPVWVFASFAPVIPVFVSPHFAYLPAVGLAIMLGRLTAGARGGWRYAIAGFFIVASLWSFGVYRYLWRGIVRSEQLIYADMVDNTPPPPADGKLFFINLPIGGIYGTVAMREAWGEESLEGYVLTFSPHPLRMPYDCTITPLNAYEFRLSVDGPGYFSGMSGEMLLEGMRPGEPLETGMVVRGAEFDVTVLDAAERGVRSLKFTFRKPLDSPEYRFLASTPERPALQVRFDGTEPAEGEIAAWRARYGDWLRERDHYFEIADFAARIIRSELLLTQEEE